MKRTALSILIAATTLAGMAQAQAPQRVHDLADARKVFRKADRNTDGRLSALELRAVGFQAGKVADHDHDGDQRISEREFYVAYRKHLAAKGQPIGADLEAEVTRELAERRARQEREQAERRKEAAKEQAEKDAEARRKGTDRIDKAKDQADAKERAEAEKRIRDARRKGTDRIEDAKDKADAKERADAQQRIRDARRKAREEAERRRKQGQGPDKRPQPNGG